MFFRKSSRNFGVFRAVLLIFAIGIAVTFIVTAGAKAAGFLFVGPVNELFGQTADLAEADPSTATAITIAMPTPSDYFFNGALTAADPIFVNPGGSTGGTGMHYYDVFQFTVGTTGLHTIETSSLNTNGAGNTSNALDTYLRLYADSFDPMAPSGSILFNDNLTGVMNVLPGPYTVDGLTSVTTGFRNAQPSSTLSDINLTAGTQYFLVTTSFRDTSYIPSSTTQPEGGQTGPYWTGISPGDIIPTGPSASPTPTATTAPSCTPVSWQTVTSFPNPGVQGAQATASGTLVYLAGGYSFLTGLDVNNFRSYDPATDTWTNLVPVPDSKVTVASAVYSPVNNKVYIFGGESVATSTVTNTTWIYDVATNTWSQGANMPDVRAFMASGYYNGKIYLVGGYNTSNVSPAFGQVWEYDPIADTFNTTRLDMPAALGGAGSGVINGHLYVAGGRDATNTVVGSLYDYDIAANTWTVRAGLTPINVPGSGVLNGKLWLFGGGTPFAQSETSGASQIYDPVTDTWTSGPALNSARSIVAGTNVGNKLIAAGGFNGATTVTTTELLDGSCAAGTPTATATATPTAAPSCTPGVWSAAAAYPTSIAHYAFAKNGEDLYVLGGVANGAIVSTVKRYNAVTNVWTPLTNIPVASEAPAAAYFNGKIYLAEGDTGNSFQIYDIAANSWSAGPARPGVANDYGAAAAAFNGNVYIVGGGTLAANTVSIYNIATNTWSTGPTAPTAFFLSGYTQVGQYLYVVGGWSVASPGANLTTTMRLDMSANTWSTGPVFTSARADLALASVGTRLVAMGGDTDGGTFMDPTVQVEQLDTSSWPSGSWVASPANLPSPRQANQAGFYSTGRSGGEIWSTGGVGPGNNFLAAHLYRSDACSTLTPTPTATATATATPTSTPNITGSVNYAIVSKPVPGTQIQAAGSPPLTVFTDSIGNYLLLGFGGGAYTVTPSRTAQPCLPAGPNGIFSNDAALISQHVVGLITLNADQLLAADVSNFHAISSFDAALIAQKVVGICSGLNHSGEWVFTPASVPHPGGVAGSLTENYRAVMIGDVSGDWNPIGPRPAEPIRRFGVPDVKASVPVMKAARRC